MKDKIYRQKYRKLWERDERFAGWIQEVPGEETKAKCKLCNATMQAHMKSIVGHAMSKRHKLSIKSNKKFVDPIGKVENQSPSIEESSPSDKNEAANCEPKNERLSLPGSFTTPPTNDQLLTTNAYDGCRRSDDLKQIHQPAFPPDLFKEHDECDLFCKTVATQMKKMSPKDIIEVQLEIYNVMAKRRLSSLQNGSELPMSFNPIVSYSSQTSNSIPVTCSLTVNSSTLN